MAITINTTSIDRIDPEEFLDWVVGNVDPGDDQSVVSASERLCALSNNRDFIIEHMRQQMLLLADGEADHISAAQSAYYGSASGPKGTFAVRSVIWTPPLTKNSRSKEMQDRILSFTTPHDHNFGLLTIGYYGPGYETIIYEYDRDTIAGEKDEDVSIRYLETTNLSRGKILYYRPCRDIHSQHHPDEISISLNLISHTPEMPSIQQYEFDVKKQKIVGLLPGNAVVDSLLPFKIIDCLGGNSNMIEIISSISKKHRSQDVRGAAYKTLAKLWPSEFDKLVLPGIDDVNPFVKNTVKRLCVDIGE